MKQIFLLLCISIMPTLHAAHEPRYPVTKQEATPCCAELLSDEPCTYVMHQLPEIKRNLLKLCCMQACNDSSCTQICQEVSWCGIKTGGTVMAVGAATISSAPCFAAHEEIAFAGVGILSAGFATFISCLTSATFADNVGCSTCDRFMLNLLSDHVASDTPQPVEMRDDL